MRSIRLGPALAAASTLLALAPTAASAARHPKAQAHRHSGQAGCRISTFAEPHLVTSGESVQVFGQLICTPATSTAGQTVTVYERSAGGGGFQVIGTSTTGANGFYSIVPPAITTDSAFYSRALGARSANRKVKVAPQVTINEPPEGSQFHTGVHHHVTFTGTVNPADEGAELILQRENATSNEEWHAIQRGIVGPGGSITIIHTFGVPGDANLRVVIRPHGKFTVRGVSSPRSYQISQAENPKLTINSLTDPIGFGASTTISGTLANGANQKVTLISRPRGGTFTKAGEATTNGNGEYSFTVSPQPSTFYRVNGAGISSAVLFEGVKYVLTASVSATTIQSGQPLTFSGTVAPDRVGHAVYLERENAFGGGFHVVDVGSVTSSGTYSIVHYMFGSGKQVYRVKVPGDPENQGTSSSPFSIEVTPALPGALRPVAQGKQPSEGQL